MSYLNPLRLHFAGQFQASVSTVNNDPVHFDNAIFKPNYQELQTPYADNGWWNPHGDGAWRLIGCKVTSAFLADGSPAAATDPIRTALIADSDRRTTAKLVDLDPEQQLVSEIWGLEVRIADSAGNTLVRGNFEPAAFTDIWTRILQGQGDITAGAAFQSVLTDLEWGDIGQSPFLQALKQAAGDGLLSIKFNVDSYSMSYGTPTFTLGRIVGSIGPASAAEPRRFVPGRQFMATTTSVQGFFQPAQQINFCVAAVDEKRGKVYLDLGNALPVSTSGGPPAPLGDLSLVCQTDPSLLKNLIIGTVSQADYASSSWYPRTAGVVELPADRALRQDDLDQIAQNPLAIWLLGTTAPQSATATMAVSENANGLYVRADQFVFRLDPGDSAPVQLYATRFGRPYPNAQVFSFLDPSQLQPNQGTILDQEHPPPPVGTPPDAITFPAVTTTDERGIAALPIKAGDPGNPRGYLDGQVYGVRTVLADMLTPYGNVFGVFNPYTYISLLIFDAFQPTEPPTWWGTSDKNSLQYIFQQFGNLYPVMLDFLDLTSYESVCRNISLLQLAYGLDTHDPNSMPVTRDLSKAKRDAILRWLKDPQLGVERSPAAPTEFRAEAGAAAAVEGARPTEGGKESALRNRLGNRRP